MRQRKLCSRKGRKRSLKFGIIMEGGASRTIFSCGVAEALMEEDIYPDVLIGVSAGIAYGVSYISGQKGRNKEFTMKYMHEPRYMGMHHLLNPKKRCYYNLAFAFDEIPNKLVPYDYEALANYPGRVISTVTNVRTGKAEFLDIPPYETLWETSIASCSLPVLFPPVKLGNQYYLDGGLADPVPWKQARAMGCDKILVIRTHERNYVKKREKGTSLINYVYKNYPEIQKLMRSRAENFNKMSDEILREEEKGNLFLITPRDTYGVKLTEGDWVKLEPLYEEGIEIGREQMPALKRWLAS